MRPLACESATPHQVTVVGGVDDDRIITEPGFIQSGHEPADRTIDAADHPVVGAHVGLVFFRRIPSPEKTLTRNRGLKAVGQVFEDGGIVQARRRNGDILIHAIDGLRPRELADAGSTVAVFGMAGIEPKIECEGFVLGLAFDEVDPAVDDELGLMSQATVWEFLVKRIASDGFEFIEVILTLPALRHLGVPFSEVSRAIAVLAKDVRVEGFDRGGSGKLGVALGAVATTRQSGEDRGTADPADRLADEGILETGTLLGKSVDVRCFDHLVAITSKSIGALVIGKEEDNIRRLAGTRGKTRETKGKGKR